MYRVIGLVAFLAVIACAASHGSFGNVYLSTTKLKSLCNVTSYIGSIRTTSVNQACVAHMVNFGMPGDELKTCDQIVGDVAMDYQSLFLFRQFFNVSVAQPLIKTVNQDIFSSLMNNTGKTLSETISYIREFVNSKGRSVPNGPEMRQSCASYIECYTISPQEVFAALWKESTELFIRLTRYNDKGCSL